MPSGAEDGAGLHVAVINISEGRFSGGYLKYLQMVLPRFRRDPRCAALDVYVPHFARDLELDGVPLIPCPAGDPRRGHPWLRRRLRETGADVAFVPAARSFNTGGVPLVVMVRNMEPLAAPIRGNRPIEAMKNLGRAQLAKRAHRRAVRTIAVSEFVRDFLVERWKVDPASVAVVEHGIEPPPDADRRRRPAALAGAPPGGFLFTAGSLRPPRGLEDAIRALARLRRQGRDRLLAVSGEPNSGTEFYGPAMQRLAERLGVGDRVVFTGHVEPREVSWCFANCEIAVVTSRVEACPNIVLEAMSHGCAIVSTDDRPMPDFLRDGAVYYRSGDASELAEKLALVMDEQVEAKRSRQDRAVSRAKDFDWHVTAERTLDELEGAARVRTSRS